MGEAVRYPRKNAIKAEDGSYLPVQDNGVLKFNEKENATLPLRKRKENIRGLPLHRLMKGGVLINDTNLLYEIGNTWIS